MPKKLLTILTSTLWLLLSQAVMAEMTLDAANSHLYFTSIKNNQVAENHHFTALSGSVNATGEAQVTIDLSSVETLIPIRNERMREILFQVQSMPTAEITTQIDMAAINAMQLGERTRMTLPLEISLQGHSVTMDADLQVVKTQANSVLATTIRPILVKAADFGLENGIKALQKVAGLDAIGLSVPVYATLVFETE
ncbi:hypothetical protein Q7C_2309 [Methylophaga frappieri]|uniref:Lipid/polyisoprenoid-binding YceI-like domain-containing protein n=2 Tax=Methylophaga frappieri (strain ATCC BAA-2434 / DSM 25690 / JAM7) TaxID=754477 RepID=I1YKK0_METFJ|nr:hypothetical protein Q7C_2309 [Methylophaga frappieri]